MKKSNHRIIELLNNTVIYLFIIVLNFFYTSKSMDSDIFFDLRSAEDILKHGLDFQDHMSMFSGLKYWYHHWLYDLIIYPIFKIGGIKLLFIFAFIISSAFFIIVYLFIKKQTNSKLVSFLSTTILVLLTSEFFDPRVKLFGYIIFLLQFISIYNLYNKGNTKYAITSVILSVLLVNIQFPLWILTPVFYMPYIAQMIYSLIIKKTNIKIFDKKLIAPECANTKLFIGTFIVILLSCVISPYGFYPYKFPFIVNTYYDSVYSYILEMRHVIVFEKPSIITCFGCLLFVLLSKKKIVVSDLCYLLGLGLLGIMSYRNIPFLLTYYVIILTYTLLNNCNIKITLNNVKNMIYPFMLIILVEITILVVGVVKVGFNEYEHGISESRLPDKLSDYIIDNIDYSNSSFYNEFNIGSYLAYRHIPVFVDSRIEVYLEKFNGKQDIINISFQDNPKTTMETFNFDYVIAIKGTNMYEYMIENNYQELYNQDDRFYLFKVHE